MDRFEWLILSGLIALIAGILCLAVRSEMAWQRFASDQHCVQTGSKSGYWYTTFMSDGRGGTYPVMQYSGDIGVYRCDGGVYEH